MDYPLEGLKVLDFSRVVAGPYATRILSDLGADVLKVEPPEGDLTRHLGQKIGEQTNYYVQQNAGKRNICIDLKAAGARDLILKLVEQADIVVENFRPGIMDKFGIGWSDLRAVNPKLVMLSISGFGQTGPDVARAAYAPIIHAESGILHRHAEVTGNKPDDLAISVVDTSRALHGVIGVLSSVLLAQRTGKGQHVDIAMIDVMHSIDDIAAHALDGIWPYDIKNNVWEAPGGRHILISGDMKWLWYVFSKQDGLADPATPDVDFETKRRLRFEAVAGHVKSYPSVDTLTARLDELNLAWGLVREFGEESFTQPTVVEHGTIVSVDDRAGGIRRTVQTPYRFSDAASGISEGASAPKRGEHNIEALADWIGVSETGVSVLGEAGVLLDETSEAD